MSVLHHKFLKEISHLLCTFNHHCTILSYIRKTQQMGRGRKALRNGNKGYVQKNTFREREKIKQKYDGSFWAKRAPKPGDGCEAHTGNPDALDIGSLTWCGWHTGSPRCPLSDISPSSSQKTQTHFVIISHRRGGIENPTYSSRSVDPTGPLRPGGGGCNRCHENLGVVGNIFIDPMSPSSPSPSKTLPPISISITVYEQLV